MFYISINLDTIVRSETDSGFQAIIENFDYEILLIKVLPNKTLDTRSYSG
jgi:hypothetical protein